jgi:predicted negative regulator of RcsB-dependent stress response
VIAEGELQVIQADADKRMGLSAIVKQYGQKTGQFNDDSYKRVLVLRLTATQLAGKSYDKQG